MRPIKDIHFLWETDKGGISAQEILMIMQWERKIQILQRLSSVQDTAHAVSIPAIMLVRLIE